MENLKDWKNPIILLFSIGMASVGDFIYLVAINIIVYQLTGSAAAVAGLWIVSPLTNIVTKFWTGSFIDYRSKRKVDRKSTRLNSSHVAISYAVFCLKKKKYNITQARQCA